MSHTGCTRTGITTGAVILAAGLAMAASGVIRSDASRSLGGTCLTIVAATLIALTLIRAWTVDTRREREDLAAQARAAAAQERKFFALEAAHIAEMERFRVDMNAERAAVTRKLMVEREAMEAELEECRLEISKKAFQMGVQMERSGMLKPDAPVLPANLIPFPNQQPNRAPEPGRSREHGFVGP